MKNLLEAEIKAEFEKLEGLTPGTEAHRAVLDGLTKLMDRMTEIEKYENEAAAQAAVRKDERVDRIVKNVIGASGVILPLMVTIWGTKAAFEFEKEVTITTILGRGFINKLLPTKK
jgi:hypothetical protein